MSDYTLPLEATTANTPDKAQPVDTDNNPLLWDGNPACISGLDNAVGKFYKRNGFFEPLFSHRAVSLSNGRLAVESLQTVPFVTRSTHCTRMTLQ